MVDATLEQTSTGAETVVWDLSPLYSGTDDPKIQQDMEKANALADTFAKKYRSKVAELDAEGMMDALKDIETIFNHQINIGSYAQLLYSTDTSNAQAGALIAKVQEFGATVGQKLVFFELEWNNLPDTQVETLLADPTLTDYQHYLTAERRFKPYQLSEAEEQLMMEKNVTGRNAWARFFSQMTSAMRYDYDGEKITQTEVLKKLFDADRDIRKNAADSMTAGLRERGMELTYIFNVLASDKALTDKRRGYESWVSSRNLDNKAPDEVVEALIQTVTDNYDLVARHYNIKRGIMGLDELTDYDRYAPLPIKQSEKRYSWDEARDIVLNAFRAFDPRMAEIAQRFFDENWIHAKAGGNKRGGAYASPVPSLHPYIFVNYLGTANDVSTLAHELGHGIHMYLTQESQNLLNQNTPLTTSEMASTFAEMLVFTDLMNAEPDPEARLAMLTGKIEDTFGTVYRQIAMNRFEHGMHTARRSEGELTTERLNEIWLDTQKAMYGDSVTMREDYGMWWSYVPHFLHTPGYVYAYSFGELLVLALFNLYQERGAEFVPYYMEVLASGDNDFPDQILAKVGVDLNDPAFWSKGIDAIRALIDQEEALAKEVYPEKFA